MKLTKNAYPGKYSYSGYGISFDIGGTFSLLNGLLRQHLTILDKSLTAEAEYAINFTEQGKKF